MIKGRVIPPVFTRWFLRSLHLITWKFTQPPFGASAAPVLTSKQDTAPRRGWANRSTGGRAKTGAAVRSHFMWITASRSAGCHHRWNEISFLSLFFYSSIFRGFWNDCSLDSSTSPITSNKTGSEHWQPFSFSGNAATAQPGAGDSTTAGITKLQISLWVLTPPLFGGSSSHKLTCYHWLWWRQSR